MLRMSARKETVSFPYCMSMHRMKLSSMYTIWGVFVQSRGPSCWTVIFFASSHAAFTCSEYKYRKARQMHGKCTANAVGRYRKLMQEADAGS